MTPEYEEEAVQIMNGNWSEEENLRIIEQISNWSVQQLCLNGNGRIEIVKQIAHIRFTNLTKLLIWGNGIQSIEGMVKIYMPYLKELHLGNNNVRSIRTMIKVNWPEMYLLNIYGNYFHDNKTLTLARFPKLQRVWVHLYLSEYKNIFTDMSFPVKLQTNLLNQLDLRSSKFAFDRSIREVFKKKWHQICVG